MIGLILNADEKEYLKLVHKIHEKHGIQLRLFSKIPYAVNYELFNGHCEFCNCVLHSRPMYVLKFHFCPYCASLHEKYIIFLIITKN